MTTSTEQPRRLTIIGSGPAGLTAAIYAARADLAPLLLGGAAWGGQLMLTTEVENFPGFPKGVQGPELMQAMRQQAERFGTTILEQNVTAVDLTVRPFVIRTSERAFTSEAVIVATGASARWLGLPSEQRLRGKGVSACATCDGFFFRGKDVAVVGGGDSAMEEATFLTKFAERVIILVRGEASRASRYMLERAQANPKISLRYQVEVEEVLGQAKVEGVRLRKRQDGSVETLPVQGLFIAIGHAPDTAIFKGQLELDVKEYIVVRNGTRTSVPGVFVAGDVQDFRYRQAVTAAGSGCMAALDAEAYLHASHPS